MQIDRAKFFAAVRPSLFSGRLSQSQVDGINAILDAAPDELTVAPLSYGLATVFHETAQTMRPIKELGGDAYFTRMYDIHGQRPSVARDLGNINPGDGVKFCGRGFVQLTGRANYAKFAPIVMADLVNQPDLAMRPDVASAVMFTGMTRGLFTGKKLSDYFGPSKADPVGARRIINGTDKADLIAGYHARFLSALTVAASAAPVIGAAKQTLPPTPAPAQVAPTPKPQISLWDRIVASLKG